MSSKYLIIIESPGKIAAYKKYLGPEYEIIPSYGHVIDLPLSKKDGGSGGLGVSKKDFTAKYEVIPDKKDVVERIVKAAGKADTVYLMSDPDREGTAIAWHLSKQLPKGCNFKRASTASITKTAILDAISKAGDIDMNMVDAYEARRILDRLVGYECSYITKQATGGPSAGRVQSAALRILADREKEIRAFVPIEYWPVQAELLTLDKKKILATVVMPDKMEIKTELHAKDIEKEIKDYLLTVATYEVKQVNRNPFPPFTTSQLQAAASNMFGWDQKRTMGVAQKLYEQGHITYMRTDSTMIEPGKLTDIRLQVSEKYGKYYLPDKPVFYKAGKNAQEAHEAIRPTHFEAEAVSDGDESKLYKLIWKRAVASQMLPVKTEQVRATFSNGRGKVVLAASGSRQLFDGWKRVYDFKEAEDRFLPEMKVGDRVDVIDVSYEQKFTEPPPRFGVASFNSKLEDLGIARPSTLATVTKTLQDRGYIETQKNVHHVTDLGIRVVDFLVSSDFCFADPNFTKEMEDDLDDILESKKEKLGVLTSFWKRLSSDLTRAKAGTTEAAASGFKCPTCAKNGEEKHLVKRFSSFGEFYSCESFKLCGFKADVGPNGEVIPKVPKPKAKPSGFKCPLCQSDLVERNGRFGSFLGCASYPKCNVTAMLDGTIKEKKPFKKKIWGKKKG